MTSNIEKRFRHSATTQWVVLIVCTACLAIVTLAVRSSSSSLVDKIFTMALATMLTAFGILLVLTKEAILTDASLTVQTALSRTTLRWADIEDVLESQRRICLKGRGRRICLSQSDYGLSLTPFNELRIDILRRANEPLKRQWTNISLEKRRSYAYPRLGVGHSIGYAIPLLLIVTVFLAYPIRAGIFGWEQLLFLAGSVALTAIFLVRDYRRSLRKLVLTKEEVQEENGKIRSVRWGDIEQLIVREGIIGYGSLVIVGRQGRKITVPRGINHCGELMFLLTKNSRATTVDAFEY
jgi:hypothetical protein